MMFKQKSAGKTKRKLCIAAAALAFAALAAGCAAFTGSSDENVRYDIDFSATEYYRNQTISLPEGTAYTSKGAVAMKYSLTYPDGTTSGESSVCLNQAGDYSLRYYAEESGANYEKTFSFNVYDAMVSLFHAGDGVSLEEDAQMPDDLKDYQQPINGKWRKYGDIIDGVALGDFNGVGLKFKKDGATVTFENPINLNEYDKTKNILQFYFAPETMGTADMRGVKLRLTDAHDETKFVQFVLADAGNVGYGHWFSVFPQYEDADVDYASWGTYSNIYPHIQTPFSGKVLPNSHSVASLVYDSGNFYFYPNFGTIERYNLTASAADIEKNIGGFTTNEVFLSIECDALASEGATGRMIISEVAGHTACGKVVKEENDLLKIAVNFNGYEENSIPYGVAGEKYSYPVFQSMAYSFLDGLLTKPQVKVYYGAFRGEVPVSGGRFATKKAGVYYIEYTFGARAEGENVREVAVDVKEKYLSGDEISVVASEDMKNTAVLGEKVFLYRPEVKGGTGKTSLETKVYFEGVPVEIISSGEYDYFVCEAKGTYEIEYAVTDYTGAETKETFEVLCSVPNAALAFTPSLPAGIKTGEKVVFPAVPATKYNENGAAVKKENCPIFVDGAETRNGEYIAAGEGEKLIEYRYEGEVLYSAKVRAIEIKEGAGFMAKYFVADGLNAAEENSIPMFSSETGGKVSFINKVFIRDFTLTFFTRGEFERISLFLRDSVNADVETEIRIENRGGAYFVVTNGKDAAETTKEAMGGGSYACTLKISDNDYSLKDGKGNALGAMKYTLNHEKFTGFASESVYLRYEVNGNGGVVIDSIHGQYFKTTQSRDITPATLYFTEKLPSYVKVKKGATVTLPTIKAIYDVLSNVTSCSVDIKATDGKTSVKKCAYEDGITFTAEEYGNYTVRYTYHDSNVTNSATYNYTVTVTETNPPVIALEEGYAKTAKAGEEYAIAKFSVSDDSTEADKIEVTAMAIDPAYNTYYLIKDGKYVFPRAGVYTIRIQAYDRFYNSARAEYIVVVTE